ncbi:TIGR03667 family PPOX class F420-dependent oxidoreductase [Mumia sp. zg.B17]|uniref:TIGR03667 family PPOX class F420-dependent oxidoreductase n=1 Tax=unclassified Mumia TaxID=2621872 RepID=UPI001C6EA9DE|nr:MULTISPECIES: TIGR03667 family PPOX class F420-dependent oxidoreductase [unclassified Mumia]MBW9205468.1 TIGR03667 family PPOX class F420-dependent oxidoreductase [Mumia sp. zg.B17]MBW9208530.1 TIGR03667 family PPOX class F420-dependent oxidoreductase [Mumia sp. zg.B21]
MSVAPTIPAAVAERLAEDLVVWLTTVNAAGEPTPTPVWFVWHDGALWIRSRPEGAKIAHLAANPHVALNLNSDRAGNDVVVLNGTATIEETMPDETWAAYTGKYGNQISGLGSTAESFAESYSTTLRVAVGRVRSW